jgi:hypothetical protein
MMRIVKFAMGLGVAALRSVVVARAQAPATLTIPFKANANGT